MPVELPLASEAIRLLSEADYALGRLAGAAGRLVNPYLIGQPLLRREAILSSPRGDWGTPINLGPAFNSPYDEYGAHLSSDGNYLFFTGHTPQGNRIFWVAVSAIEKLRPR